MISRGKTSMTFNDEYQFLHVIFLEVKYLKLGGYLVKICSK